MPSPAAQVQASTIAPITAAARSPSMLRASPTSEQLPATTFDAVPPSITPRLAVVSSSSRPSSIAATAAAPASIALLPSSGLMPACASVPVNVAVTCLWVGAATITSPIGLAWSSTNPKGARRAA